VNGPDGWNQIPHSFKPSDFMKSQLFRSLQYLVLRQQKDIENPTPVFSPNAILSNACRFNSVLSASPISLQSLFQNHYQTVVAAFLLTHGQVLLCSLLRKR